MLSANCSCTSAPVSRANCSWRAASARQASASQSSWATVMALPATANHSQCPWSSVAGCGTSSSSSARRSDGAAARCPFVTRRAQPVEQHVAAAGEPVRRRRAQRGLGDGSASRPAPSRSPAHIAAPQRLEVRLASQADGHRLEPPRRACQKPRRLADAALVEGDLSAQHLDAGAPELVERLGVDRAEQSQCGVERTGVALGPGRRQPPRGSARWVGRQRAGALEERGRGGEPAASLRPGRRALQFHGDRARPEPSTPGRRCQARRSGSTCGSVASASARWTARRSCSVADR